MKAYPENAELIICTEQGYLENMSKLLIWTIREFGGRLRNIPIYSYQPRKGYEVSENTAQFFKQHNVQLIDEILNTEYLHYPLANKIFACAHREQNTTADSLIFMDSDIFFLNEPAEMLHFNGHHAILRPVDYKIVGTEGPGDANYQYWEKLYKLLGVQEIRKVMSTVDRKTIYEYYNSGHIAVKTTAGLFSRWLKNFHLVMRAGLRPGKKMAFEEQTIFAGTVTQMGLKVKPANEMYNLPVFPILHNRDVKKQTELFGSAVCIHYHKVFKNVYGYNPLYEFLEYSDRGRLINAKLEEFEIIKKGSNLAILKHKLMLFYSNYLKSAKK
jgi:hypothetical protein